MKRNYWPLLFIGIFSFTFGMIVWTIMSAVKLPVNEDESFLKSYQDVDVNYNKMMYSNKSFNEKYELKLVINSKEFGLTTEDIKYSQRVLEKKSKHKDVLKKGDNNLSLKIIDKKTNEVKNAEVTLKVTKSSTSKLDIILLTKDFINQNDNLVTKFNLPEENNWNITGSFEIDGEIGYIYIKTNAI